MAQDQADASPKDERVHIEPYNAMWPAQFASEAAAITTAIGPWITGGIQHIGSTAVPGLAAKPIIDIMVGVADLKSSRPCIDMLAPLRYCYAPYQTEAMHWFCKPHPARRTHHLHLVPAGSPRFVDVLVFRNYLRAHPDANVEYETVKRELAARYAGDRETYTSGKSAIVAQLTEAARCWARNVPSVSVQEVRRLTGAASSDLGSTPRA
ncbi:MAG: GrpB family protein [Acidimicrobiales bacterium]|nr:MAG: GrpB family protein [Acidimicrobiales bacterium]